MTPEGLYQSIRNMAQKVNDPDMNVIRLTYAIQVCSPIFAGEGTVSDGPQMIDDIVDGNEFSLKHSFELHNYNNGLENGNCADFNMYDQGYNAMDTSLTVRRRTLRQFC